MEDRGGEGTTTGTDGQYLISGVPTVSGFLTVTATASLGGVPYQARSAAFTPVPGGQAELGELVLAPYTATLMGVVLDPANRPVSGAKVVIVASGPLFFRGTTGADGGFRVSGVPQNGTVTLVVSEIQGRFTLQAARRVLVAAPVMDLGTLFLAPTETPTTFRGTIVDTANRPVAGAWVKVFDEEVLATATSAADGSFMILDLPSGGGSYFGVTARIAIGGNHYYGRTDAFAVENGVTDLGAIVVDVLPAGGAQTTTVRGELATLSGQPISDAEIIVFTEMDAYLWTASVGRYAALGIPTDEGNIWVVGNAVLDGQHLTAYVNSYDPDAPDRTFEPLVFDDTYSNLGGGGGEGLRSRKLAAGSRLPPFGAGIEALCRSGGR